MSTKVSIALAALAISTTSLSGQVQTIKRLPPPSTGSVATLNLPAPTKEGEIRPITETLESKIVTTAGLPDLVVREIRRDGTGKFAMRVANQGPLRAGTFAMMLELVGPANTERMVVDVPALNGGGEYWVTAELTEPSKIAKMRAIADAAYVNSKVKADGSFTWGIVSSKVTESDETNNTFEVVPPA